MKKTTGVLMAIALFIASLNLRPAITSIAPLLETIQNDLNMSASIASLLTSIPVFCMGIFSPIAAKLGGRWGIERVLGWSLVLIGIGTVLRLYTHSTFFLLITAFIAGFGIAATGPLLSGFIKRHFPKQVPFMIGVYTVALTLGAALGSGLSAPLQSNIHSWQTALAVWAVFALVGAPVWWLFVMRSIERSTIAASMQKRAKLPWGNKEARLLTLSFGFMSMMFYSITAWLPQIIHGMGYSEVYAGNVLTIFTAIQIPVSLVFPILLKRYPSRFLWALVCSSMELVGLFMIVFSIQLWIAAIILGIGAGGLFPLNLLLPIDATSNAQDAATWSAMTQSVGYMIGAMGPIILGWIHDMTNSFFLAVIGLIIINLIMIMIQLVAIPRHTKQKHIESVV